MVTVTKKAEQAWPVTSEWRQRVIEELDRRGRGSRAELAAYLGISRGQVHDMLSADSRYSRYVPRVHKFFGWPAPAPPLMSQDLEEIRHVLDAMGEEGREFFRALKNMDRDQQRAMIAVALQMSRSRGN